MIRLEIDYKAPARLDDLVRIETVVLEVGRTSFTLGQRAVRVVDDVLLASGQVTLVCVMPGMKAKRLPAEVVHLLKRG